MYYNFRNPKNGSGFGRFCLSPVDGFLFLALSVFSRRHAGDALEGLVEVGEIRKTAFPGCFRYGQGRISEQSHRKLDPPDNQVFVRRDPRDQLEMSG